jgi:hypothetical protein
LTTDLSEGVPYDLLSILRLRRTRRLSVVRKGLAATELSRELRNSHLQAQNELHDADPAAEVSA